MHPKSFNFRHFETAEDKGSKIWHHGHLQRHDLPAEFHNNIPLISNVIGRDTQTDRQMD
jgi:hypothetical protein